jgi:hypothetical protein
MLDAKGPLPFGLNKTDEERYQNFLELPFVEEVPERPNPVTQDEMDAGSVELF